MQWSFDLKQCSYSFVFFKIPVECWYQPFASEHIKEIGIVTKMKTLLERSSHWHVKCTETSLSLYLMSFFFLVGLFLSFLQWLVFPVLFNCWWSMIIEHLRKCIGNPHVYAMAASGKTPTAEPHHFQMRKSKFHVFRCSGFLRSRIGLEISNVNVGT